jgi:pimeloyl-ACP methyl ester carboxylesterase
MKKLKKWYIIVLAVVVVIALAFIGVAAYLGYSMTRVERVPVTGSPADKGLAYEDVSFTSLNKNLTLWGWFLPAERSDRVIIMVHGNGGNRNAEGSGALDIAGELVGHGFNVLMFDLHGSGESEGNTVSGGYYEREDLEGAVDYVGERGFEKIGVLGFSLGAVTALLAAAEDQEIDAVVSDSAFADLNDIIEPEFAKRTHAPKFFLHPILFMVKIIYGVDFTAIRPVAVVAQIAPRPILFIHGEADDMIPADHARRLLEASGNPDNILWIVPGGHTSAYHDYPAEFIDRVTAFFDAALR